MTALLDTPLPPAMTAEQEAAFLEWLRAVEAKALRVAAERDEAQAEARGARADAAALLRVNLELQRHLNEYNADRRAYEHHIADLEAELGLLRAAVASQSGAPRRGRWRR